MSVAVRRSRYARLTPWIGLAIAVASIAILALTVDLRATLESLAAADLRLMLFVLPVMGAQLLVRAERWKRLLAGLAHIVARRRLVPVLLVGYLGNTVLPARAGEVIRTGLLSIREQIPGGTVFATVAVERVLDTFTLGLLALATMLGLLAGAIGSAVIASATLAVCVSVVALLVAKRCSPWVARKARATAHGGRLRGMVGDFAEAISRLTGITLVVAGLLSAFAWGGDAVLFWFSSQAVGLDATFGQAFVIASVAVLATAIPSVPAYLGTFELASVAAGTALGLAPEEVLAVATIAHVTVITVVTIAGATSAILIGFSFGSRSGIDVTLQQPPERDLS